MELKVGDILFKRSRYSGLTKVKVVKITPSGNIRVNDGALLRSDLRKKTSDSWDNDFYYEYTDKLESEWRMLTLKAKIETKIKNLKLSELNELQLNNLLDLLSEF